MKKLLILLFSILISLNSYGEWTYVSSNITKDDYYVDFDKITKMGIKRIYTPKDYDLNKIISEMSEFVEESAA